CRVYKDDQPQDNAHNLLLWNVIKWAKKNGIETFNLGGRDASGSFAFKEGWSNDRKPYFIGKKILLPAIYKELQEKTGTGGKTEGYFPVYRNQPGNQVG
ncbi:MAG: hypothetical protein UY48_C0049G0013, partial [Candidatus Gottesmanbacteria bacterium GW2011_GWB1_49_7]